MVSELHVFPFFTTALPQWPKLWPPDSPVPCGQVVSALVTATGTSTLPQTTGSQTPEHTASACSGHGRASGRRER